MDGFEVRQILARIGFGATTMLALVWVLWPTDWTTAFEPEPLFVFVVSAAAWVSAELFNGKNYSRVADAVGHRAKSKELSENDLRNSRQIISYYKFAMRDLLKNQDLGAYFNYMYLSELHAFVHANEEGQFEYLDKEIAKRWALVVKKFKDFARFMAQNSTPDLIAGKMMVRLDHQIVALMVEGAVDKPSKSEEGNVIASDLWQALQNFVDFLKDEFPATTDVPSEQIWFYSSQA